MKLIIKIIMFILIAGCNDEDYYKEEIIGNKKIITQKSKGKIGTTKKEYQRIKVLKLRVDDDSEYHITYELNGNTYSDNDLHSFEIYIKNKTGESWIGELERPKYRISYPSNEIEYFED